MRSATLILAVVISLISPLYAASLSTRQIEQFTEDWHFSLSDAPDTQSPTIDDSTWHTVTLPHDWSIAGPVDPNNPSGYGGGFFPTGVAWYRKTFTYTPQSGRHTFIVFDGIMANSDVYCNGELLGHRPYGYVSFNYDLTPHLHAGKNIIAVRADNSQQPASRWYPGAGINRQVRLVTVADTHIVPWGTFVTTPQISTASAKIHVRSTVTNESAESVALTLRIIVLQPNGAWIPRGHPAESNSAIVAPHAITDLNAELTIPDPDCWDLAHGSLYTAYAVLLRNGKPVDEESVPFGIREFRFDPDQGFFLNGVHHKINGVALHTDAGALGTAVPLAAWQRRLEALRALGVNAIRTAHNPPTPEFLDLCDRMGFLVMDEFFDCWTVGKNPHDYHLYFRDWSNRDEADTIQRDRNHPSIMLYSVGNEIHDTPRPDIAIPILKQLVATAHTNDPTRPVTQALFRPNVSHDYDDGLADLLDVIGQNYREQEILKAHADKPTRKIIGTENTHDRNQWIAMRDHPEYSGQFLWSGIDYLGEAGRWPSIGAGSGLLMTTSLPRARAFERQSWWSTTPMVRVARRVQVPRRSPTDPGYTSPTSNNQQITTNIPLDPTTRFGQPLLLDWSPKDQSPHTEQVEIYTNAEEVELLVNNKSLGTQKPHPDASPIAFEVPYAPGVITAVARTNGKVVAQDELHTAGAPAHLVLSTGLAAARLTNTPTHEPLPHLTPDWNDVTYITATLVDANGTVIPDSETRIHFSVSGNAKIIAVDNGNMLDHDLFQATDRKVYSGHAIVILRATAPNGNITLTASAEGLPPATSTFKAKPAAPTVFQRSF